MLKGMTAQYLLRRTYKVGRDTTLLFDAAAGGVGLIACQWAASLGATVIGTVGSAGKVLIARAHGCAHVINIREEDVVAKVKDYTGGKGVDVVYDFIGKDAFPASLDCLKRLGMWVSFGQASGPVPPFNITLLSQKGSLFATRPSLANYIETRKDLVATANELFDVIAKGTVKIAVNQTYPLAEAAEAQRDLEARHDHGIDSAVGLSLGRALPGRARRFIRCRILLLVTGPSLRLVKELLPWRKVNAIAAHTPAT